MRRMHKKGALELSINAIVIVILAMTLLGLGLGFVRNMFNDITGMQRKVTRDMEEQILSTLRQDPNKKLAISTNIEIQRGKSEVIGLGLQNTENEEIMYGINVSCLKKQGMEDCGDDPVNTFYDESVNRYLKPTDAKVESVTITSPSSTGRYIFEIIVCASTTSEPAKRIGPADVSCINGTGAYARQSFYVTVQ